MLSIKPATPADSQTVITVLLDATRWLQSRGLPTWNPDDLPPVLSAAIERGDVYLAYLNNQPVGTITVQWSDEVYWGKRGDDAGYVHKLATVRAVAGQHIGAQMLTWAEQLIAGHERPFSRLDCHAANPAINRFYQAAGYELQGSLVLPKTTLNLYEKRLIMPEGH